ncbi:MAG: helix-turn-helix domain-containing protein [Oscillospiraceae bacterium]|nr:helix-turn-helix domain-containing protein [Oscillospiraceae bacterium]
MRDDVTVHRVVKTEKRRGEQIPDHRHPFFHYIYCLRGHTQVTVGTQTFPTDERTLVLVPPETGHSILGLDSACSLDVKFSCSDALRSRLCTLPVRIERLDGYEDDLLRGIFEEAVSQQEDYDELINLRLYELLILLLRQQDPERERWESRRYPAAASKNERIRPALEYIEAHLREPIRVSELADVCGYNRNYFQSIFKEDTGVNPGSYISRRRIALARERMMYSEATVTEVSEYLGFQSIHYFSRLFRRLCGVTPTEYMRRVKEARPINVQHNEFTPEGEFEIPLQQICDPEP